jgi:transcriptional regulator with XRE-family HTH domain
MLTNLGPMRRAKGMSQEQLAALVGQHASALSRYEHGCHIPLVSTAARIAAALDCTIDELVSSVERNDNHAA